MRNLQNPIFVLNDEIRCLFLRDTRQKAHRHSDTPLINLRERRQQSKPGATHTVTDSFVQIQSQNRRPMVLIKFSTISAQINFCVFSPTIVTN